MQAQTFTEKPAKKQQANTYPLRSVVHCCIVTNLLQSNGSDESERVVCIGKLWYL